MAGGSHPTPYYTTIALHGLLTSGGDKQVINKAIEYLISTVESVNGWPEHERDFVTSYIVRELISFFN